MQRLVKPRDIEFLIGSSSSIYPCQPPFAMTGPKCVIDHDRRLDAPVKLLRRGTTPAMLRQFDVTSATGRTTLATVAASAGVSVATVSKVVNGRADVAASTRAPIQELLRQHASLSFAANRRPAERGRTTTLTIEVFFQDQLVVYSTEILNGVLEAAADLGVSVRGVGPAAGRGLDGPSTWARDLATAGRKAVVAVTSVLTAADLSVLSRARVPIVVIDALNMPHARVTSVGSTNFAGGVAATEHLLSLGHRRIAYLGGPLAAACNQARMHGSAAPCMPPACPVIEDFVRSEQQDYNGGFTGAATLLDRPDPPTAVFTFCDEMALGVVEAAPRARAADPRRPERRTVSTTRRWPAFRRPRSRPSANRCARWVRSRCGRRSSSAPASRWTSATSSWPRSSSSGARPLPSSRA